uniref:Uncharacterized protein n=1 Tax=viral metagenome TaxID=1070528 RepID=A0A6C0C1U7_9ZZZZ
MTTFNSQRHTINKVARWTPARKHLAVLLTAVAVSAAVSRRNLRPHCNNTILFSVANTAESMETSPWGLASKADLFLAYCAEAISDEATNSDKANEQAYLAFLQNSSFFTLVDELGPYKNLMLYILKKQLHIFLVWIAKTDVVKAINAACSSNGTVLPVSQWPSARRLCIGQVCTLQTPDEENGRFLFIPSATVLYCRLGDVIHPFFIHRNLLCWYLKHLKATPESTPLEWEVLDLTLPACLTQKPAVALFSFLPTAPPTPEKSVIDRTVGYTAPRRGAKATALFQKIGTTRATTERERREKEGIGPNYVHRRYDFTTRIGFENAARIRRNLEPLFGEVSPSVREVFQESSNNTPEFYYFEQRQWKKQNSRHWEWDSNRGNQGSC